MVIILGVKVQVLGNGDQRSLKKSFTSFQAAHESVLIGHFLDAKEFSHQASGREMATTGKYFGY